jgi:transcriptional regulator with XRE-family HTH domain
MATKPSRAEANASNALASYLASVRQVKGLTLREVEEATGKDVSNAYLSQLERGKISKPSPHILHSLSEVYCVAYENLMELAGYIAASSERGNNVKHGSAATFASENLTPEEEADLLQYLQFLRSRKSKF